MLKLSRFAPLALATLAVAAAPTAHAASAPIRYEGTTKEGTKMSFKLKGPWIDGIGVRMPYTCVSAQGGTPRAGIVYMIPLFKFRLGAQNATAKEEAGITKNYTFSSRGKPGKAISGSFRATWSELTGGATSSEMKILECVATVNFKIKPAR